MWIYVIAAVVIVILLKELIRLPTVGRYSERYVFITGCDTGFGNLLAKRLDSLGFNVFAGCFTEKGADELKEVSSARLKTLSLDVSKIESINEARKFVDKHLPENKGLWAVVNNAGIFGPMGASEWFTKKEYVTCLGVNLFGVIDVVRVFQPLLREGQGRVVNMASVSGRISVGGAPYVCSKYGVEAFSDCLRRETLHQGITVHIIEPGLFDTNISEPAYMRKAFSNSFREASPDVQAYYGEKLLEKALRQVGPTMAMIRNKKISLVVDAYTHAITAVFPKYRYLVGNDSRFLLRPIWNLPEWLGDRILTAGNTLVPQGNRPY